MISSEGGAPAEQGLRSQILLDSVLCFSCEPGRLSYAPSYSRGQILQGLTESPGPVPRKTEKHGSGKEVLVPQPVSLCPPCPTQGRGFLSLEVNLITITHLNLFC